MATPTTEEVKGQFKNFLGNIGNAIKDAASLNVMTVKGNIKLDVSGAGDLSKVDLNKLEDIFADGKIKANLSGEITPIANTVIKLDFDSYTYVNQNLSEEDKYLMESHQAMLKSAIEGRLAVVEFAKKLL